MLIKIMFQKFCNNKIINFRHIFKLFYNNIHSCLRYFRIPSRLGMANPWHAKIFTIIYYLIYMIYYRTYNII
jgi:hypothetical protein